MKHAKNHVQTEDGEEKNFKKTLQSHRRNDAEPLFRGIYVPRSVVRRKQRNDDYYVGCGVFKKVFRISAARHQQKQNWRIKHHK